MHNTGKATTTQIPVEAQISVLDGHIKQILSLDFSHDGKLLVSLSNDNNRNSVIIWDWRKSLVVATAIANTSPVYSIRFNPFQAYGIPDDTPKPGQAQELDDVIYTLCSTGVRHVKFWVLLRTKDPTVKEDDVPYPDIPGHEPPPAPKKWFLEGNLGRYGSKGHAQDALSIDFVDDSPNINTRNEDGKVAQLEGVSDRTSSRMVIGTRSGDVYVFKQPAVDLYRDRGGKKPPPPWWLAPKQLRGAFRGGHGSIQTAKRLWDSVRSPLLHIVIPALHQKLVTILTCCVPQP